MLSVVAKLCVLPGDSGGAGESSASEPWASRRGRPRLPRARAAAAYAGFFQMVSPGGGVSVTSLYTDWEMIATVSAPSITSISTSGGQRHRNQRQGRQCWPQLQGRTSTSTAPARSSPPPMSTRRRATGPSTSAVCRRGFTRSPPSRVSESGLSHPQPLAASVVDSPLTESTVRIVIAVGVKIAQAAYPSGGAPVIFITTGFNYPDALVGGTGGRAQRWPPDAHETPRRCLRTSRPRLCARGRPRLWSWAA